MKVVVTVLVLVATTELVLGVPGYGPPQPLPNSPKFNRPHPNGGAPIPAKYPPPHFGGNFGKNEFYSKYNPHSLPPGVRGPPPPQLPPHFGKYPPPPPPGKYQQHQNQHPQQPQQQQQQQQQQHQPHHPHNFRPLGPQFQSKPHLLPNGAPTQGQIGGGGQERLQQAQSRPVPKITNIYGAVQKLPGPPDFPPRFPAPVAPVQPSVPFQEKPIGPYIINSDDERGPIKTIPAPNLNPADKPANFEEQLYRAQHQQSYAQPLDNSIIDERPSYQVTEDPSKYKPFSGQPSYFAPDPDTVPTPKVPPTTDINSIPTVGKLPLDIALQQHLDKQHQQLLSAEHSAGSSETLTPHELYTLLNGNPTSVVAPQTAYMVPQPVVYTVPQQHALDAQASGHQLQYQPQSVPLQYAQQPAATAVHLQFAQPAAADLQYLQPQTVQYQPQVVQYQPQTVQYQPQAVHYQHFQQRPAEQYGAQPTAEGPAYEHQAQQHQQEQEQQQQHEQHVQEQQQEQEQEQQHDQQREQQVQNNDVQYQQEDYQPRNRDKEAAAASVEQEEQDAERDQHKFESIRNQYYSAVPNEQTAGVLAQIAESAANNDAAAAADEPSRVDTVPKSADTAAADQTVQLKTTVQIQQSVPLYEGTYASSRRTNQEYADDGGDGELMEGSESVVSVSGSPSSVNGHAPSQFPYNAAKINAFSAN